MMVEYRLLGTVGSKVTARAYVLKLIVVLAQDARSSRTNRCIFLGVQKDAIPHGSLVTRISPQVQYCRLSPFLCTFIKVGLDVGGAYVRIREAEVINCLDLGINPRLQRSIDPIHSLTIR